MTTAPDAPDLRQAAIAAAVGAYADHWRTRYQAARPEAGMAQALDAALAVLAEGLYIADRGDGEPAVYDETRPPGRQCIIGPDSLSDRVWALLAAVIPTRQEGQS